VQNFLTSNRKIFAMDREELRSRQMQALQSRHAAGLTDKVIARAIDRHPDTIGNWRLGVTFMSVADMMALDEFFSSMGDWAFVETVCGELALRRRLHAHQLEQRAKQLRDTAAMLSAEPIDEAAA
jgi:hypothetical protein